MNNVNQIRAVTVQADFVTDIYNEYYNKIYKYTLYRVGDHSATEDLVSEVFEKVIVKYYTYNPNKAKLNTWLFAIANNTIINHYKKSQYQAASSGLERMQSPQNLEDAVIAKENKELLLKAIRCLDERQRNVIALKFGANLTNRDIAQMLNLTESNVGTILYRSIKRLRDVLNEQGVNY